MRSSDWWNGIKAAITVCDSDGIVLDMNEAAAGAFSGDGGRQLVGKSLMDMPSGKCAGEAAVSA